MTVGFYQAAFAVASLAGYSYYLGVALYPLLLRGGAGSEELPTVTLDLSLLFGIPMAVGAAFLAKPILFVLSPTYVQSTTALEILAFASLANATNIILDQILAGKETIDADESAGVRRFVHSNLFFVFLVDFGSTFIYVLSVLVIVAAGTASGASPITTIDLWAAAQLVVFSAFAVVRVLRIRKGSKLSLRPSLLRYVAGSGVMAVFFVIGGRFLDYGLHAATFVEELGGVALAGVGIYFLFLYATESEFRRVVRMVLKPLTGSRAT
jgi:hypothetical protein